MQASCNFPAINRNLGLLLEVYTSMIKSNFTMLNSVICTLIMYVKTASYTLRMLTAFKCPLIDIGL